MTISASQVKELREKTGVGMMECKKALTENGGDIEKAILWLRERGLSRAAKKAGRTTAEGLVAFAVSDNNQMAAVVEVNCETDFAAKNQEFISFVNQVTEIALKEQPNSVDQLKELKMGGQTVGDALTDLIAKVGENMSLRRVKAYNTNGNGIVVGYNHMGGKIGALIEFSGVTMSEKAEEVGKDLAMHIAASAPRFLNESEVSEQELQQEAELARKKLQDEGKPAEMVEKIMQGQMKKFFKEVCLIDQPFVKEPKTSVNAYFKSTGLGGEIASFTRFQLGEGIEKEQSDFAAEVAAQVKGN